VVSERSERNHRFVFVFLVLAPLRGARTLRRQNQGWRRFAAYPWLISLHPFGVRFDINVRAKEPPNKFVLRFRRTFLRTYTTN
jgi:hypothetical protein